MPLQETSGTASYDAFGGGVPVAAKYIEQYFSTWLRTGTGASATITTGLDASTNKALVWTKSRSAATDHKLTDTVRGATKALISDTTGAQTTDTNGLTAFSSTGYTIGSDTNYNNSGATYVDWEFVATPKFFDVVTYTGNGSTKTISHNLGSTPGCIIVKRTASSSGWYVYHRSLAANNSMELQATGAAGLTYNFASVTSTSFNVTSATDTNENNQAYVAYLFAHDAGGFGLTGTDNVISCGSFTTNGIGQATVDLGYEPQWLMYKGSSAVTNWSIADNMRGFVVGAANAGSKYLNANSSSAELDTPPVGITNTGFNYDGAPSTTFIYIAIRRGPMKTPTSGTSVYQGITRSGTGATATVSNVGFPSDLVLIKARNSGGLETAAMDRLRGAQLTLLTPLTDSEYTLSSITGFDSNVGYTLGTLQGTNGSGFNFINWNFRRAPGFFDEVCFTAMGSTFSVTHNLGVAPELVITKERNGANAWYTYSATYGYQYYLSLNGINAKAGPTAFFGTGNPTSTTLSLSGGTSFFSFGQDYVAYLFASCPGVSKVGSYTGTGATQTISCGFAARFVLIKRTDSTGDWFVWDTARGMVAGTDPRLALNSTAAETNANWVYTDAAGFQIVTTDATVNASGGSYIYLCIA